MGCILENVVGITHSTSDGHEPVSAKFIRALEKFCPEFSWRLDRLELVDYLLPQSRIRIFMRGMRKCIASMVPDPLPSWGRRHLRDALAVNVPNTPRSSFTKPQQKNLVAFEQMVVSMVKKGTLQEDDVVVVDRGQMC